MVTTNSGHLRTLQQEDAPPFLDRAAIEALFGLRRRRAISILHRFEGYRIGRAFVVNRQSVVACLEHQLTGGGLAEAQEQRRSVSEFLGQARYELRLPTIPLPPPAKLSEITFDGLPAGIHLAPGRLSITFDTPQDLVEKLFALAQACANDYESLTEAARAQSEDTLVPDR